MADLNIRNFPPDLLKQLKANAAYQGCSLREICIAKLMPSHGPAIDWRAEFIDDAGEVRAKPPDNIVPLKQKPVPGYTPPRFRKEK